MLTGNLVRARVHRDAVRPRFVDPDEPTMTSTAEALVALWTTALADRATRGDVDAAVEELIGHRPDHLVVRGLAKICADRSTFVADTTVDPIALRAEVFREAATTGPLALRAGPFERPTADDVLGTVGERHDLSADQVRAALYADLREAHRLETFDVPSGRWLLDRYNVALAQALLLKALSVRVELEAPTAPRMRQLFRYAKFFQLICAAERSGDTLVLTVDGPTSLFRQSTRYGMQLANFLPALLLHEGQWRLQATVLWTKRRLEKTLELNDGDGLVSHYRDRGAWRSKEQTYFAERFEAADTGWSLAEGSAPIDLAGRAVVWPDFTLTRDGRQVHLEIVGFWRKDWLERRLALLREWGPANLIVAISTRLRGSAEALEGFDGAVVQFAEVLSPRKVLAAIDALAE